MLAKKPPAPCRHARALYRFHLRRVLQRLAGLARSWRGRLSSKCCSSNKKSACGRPCKPSSTGQAQVGKHARVEVGCPAMNDVGLPREQCPGEVCYEAKRRHMQHSMMARHTVSHMWAHTPTNTHAHIPACTHTCTRTHARTHAHTRTRTLTHTHTRSHAHSLMTHADTIRAHTTHPTLTHSNQDVHDLLVWLRHATCLRSTS